MQTLSSSPKLSTRLPAATADTLVVVLSEQLAARHPLFPIASLLLRLPMPHPVCLWMQMESPHIGSLYEYIHHCSREGGRPHLAHCPCTGGATEPPAQANNHVAHFKHTRLNGEPPAQSGLLLNTPPTSYHLTPSPTRHPATRRSLCYDAARDALACDPRSSFLAGAALIASSRATSIFSQSGRHRSTCSLRTSNEISDNHKETWARSRRVKDRKDSMSRRNACRF
ncbi:hypothetical protein B0H19DRAFT_1245439 [Mycena capillaripes]|nr:hypothetical protein B0H19DRAFT_1245439 [Mycena capillaripes]